MKIFPLLLDKHWNKASTSVSCILTYCTVSQLLNVNLLCLPNKKWSTCPYAVSFLLRISNAGTVICNQSLLKLASNRIVIIKLQICFQFSQYKLALLKALQNLSVLLSFPLQTELILTDRHLSKSCHL